MAAPPKPPPKLYGPPRPGWNSPQFPIIGPTEMKGPYNGEYRSQIGVGKPIDAAQQKKIATVQAPPRPFGDSSGDKSRSAFARALLDTSENALSRATDKFNTEYRAQAEKSRAEDILAQRQNAGDRLNMDSGVAVFNEDTDKRWESEKADINSYYQNQKRVIRAQKTANILRGVFGGILGGLF